MTIVIDHIKGERATLRTDDGSEFVVSTAELPTGAQEGDTCVIRLSRNVESVDARTAQAKEILNEILGDGA